MRPIAIVATLMPLLAAALPAHAEIGPCQPDQFDSFICGSGEGAARIIEDTLSPDKTLAFAWRNPKAAPMEGLITTSNFS